MLNDDKDDGAHVEKNLLKAMYEALLDRDNSGLLCLAAWRENNSIEEAVLRPIVSDLYSRGIIGRPHFTLRGLTAFGLQYVEGLGVLLPELLNESLVRRERLLEEVAKRDEAAIEKYGRERVDGLWIGGDATIESLVDATGFAGEVISAELCLLGHAGLVIRCHELFYRLTEYGTTRATELRIRRKWMATFYDLRVLNNRREAGIQFEPFIADILSTDGWDVFPNVGAEGEQIDLLVRKENVYYLIECRWRTKKPTSIEFGGFRERVAKRGHGTNGMFISMCGFPKHVCSEAGNNKHESRILLFGPKDVERLARMEVSFTDLVEKKTYTCIAECRAVVE